VKYNVTVRQGDTDKIFECEEGTNLLNLLQKNDYHVNSLCGGQGVCGKCKIRILEGGPEISPQESEYLTDKEMINGVRLACRIDVENDLILELDQEEEIEVMTEGVALTLKLNPDIKKIPVVIEKPSLEDQRAYLQRVLDELNIGGENQLVLSPVILKQLEKVEDETITVTLKDDNIVQLEKGDQSQNNYGIAVDIGTTTIAIYLMNLNTGEGIDVCSLHNPQKKYGADVISRINYTMQNDGGTEELQQVLIRSLNVEINSLVKRNKLKNDDIMLMTFVGNTIMMHTLLGINARTIALSPYIPVFTSSLELTPGELGLDINQAGTVKLLPSVAGYVGADIIGDMLVADFESDNWNLLLDIGTNGEIVLGNREKLYACSAAAGPAFEGAGITFGMAGVPGAISKYRLNNGKVEYQTIADKKAKGICGSGLVDVIAEMLQRGFLQSTGAMTTEENLPADERKYLTDYKGKKAYRILSGQETADGEEIVLTQKDIREFQLARGAIMTGIKILLKEAGITIDKIKNVFLAGGFGNYIAPHNACLIGLVPGELEDKIIRIGNGAGLGAKMYLLDKELSAYAEEISKRVDYIELSSRVDFQNEFMESMFFDIPAMK